MRLSQTHADNIEQERGVFIDKDTVKYNREGYDPEPEEECWLDIPDEWIIDGIMAIMLP